MKFLLVFLIPPVFLISDRHETGQGVRPVYACAGVHDAEASATRKAEVQSHQHRALTTRCDPCGESSALLKESELGRRSPKPRTSCSVTLILIYILPWGWLSMLRDHMSCHILPG